MRQGVFQDITDFIIHLIQRFWEDDGPKSAGALTYTTLFAVVPMMTVIFVMLAVIPAFQGISEQIQDFIFRNFVPSAGETVQEYLHGFTDQARQLTWIGIAVLIGTAFMMLVTIEQAFNTIWRVRKPRQGIYRVLLYWALLSLGPSLLGASFAVSTYIASLSVITGPEALPGVGRLFGLMPLFASIAGFTLLYFAVPNARVPFSHALVGGMLTAALIELAKYLFTLYVKLFPSYQLIYGAFATVPLFLLWIYLSWCIVLFGCELVYCMGLSPKWRRRGLPDFLVALGVLRIFHDRQKRGLSVAHRTVQAEGWPLPEDEWATLLDFFEEERLVCSLGSGEWVLCRDLNDYPMSDLLSRSPWHIPGGHQLPESLQDNWYEPVRRALLALEERQDAIFHGSLVQWLQPEELDSQIQNSQTQEGRIQRSPIQESPSG